MKKTVIPALIGLSVALLNPTITAQDKGDIEMLEALVQQTRAELQALRKLAGIPAERREGRGEHGGEGRGEHGGEGRGEHGGEGREGRGEHGGEGREGRGEHGGEGREGGEGEESGKRLGMNDTWNENRKGAHLVLAYDASTQSFRGTVKNASTKTLSQVRVEVHLSNGVELGPTKRIDLAPGKTMRVELSAANQKFKWWTTHPEHGTEEGHGPGHEGKEGGTDKRPKDPALRPLYNELLLLRGEVQTISEGMRQKSRNRRR